MRGLSQNKAIWRRFATWNDKTLVLRLKVREGSRKWRRNGNDGVILDMKPVPRGSYRGELVISVIDYLVNSDEPPRGVSEGLPEGLDRVLQARLKRRRQDGSSPFRGATLKVLTDIEPEVLGKPQARARSTDLAYGQGGSIPSRAPKKKPRKRGQGSPGVTFLPKWRGDARKARRESVHGDAGIRKLYQNTKQMILT